MSSCRLFYSAADRFVKALHALFNDNRAFNNSEFLENGLNGFLPAEDPLSSTLKPAVVQIFVNNMKLFGHDSSDRSKSKEQQALNWQWRSVRRIRFVFLTSTTAGPLQPAASNVALDVILR